MDSNSAVDAGSACAAPLTAAQEWYFRCLAELSRVNPAVAALTRGIDLLTVFGFWRLPKGTMSTIARAFILDVVELDDGLRCRIVPAEDSYRQLERDFHVSRAVYQDAGLSKGSDSDDSFEDHVFSTAG